MTAFQGVVGRTTVKYGFPQNERGGTPDDRPPLYQYHSKTFFFINLSLHISVNKES